MRISTCYMQNCIKYYRNISTRYDLFMPWVNQFHLLSCFLIYSFNEVIFSLVYIFIQNLYMIYSKMHFLKTFTSIIHLIFHHDAQRTISEVPVRIN